MYLGADWGDFFSGLKTQAKGEVGRTVSSLTAQAQGRLQKAKPLKFLGRLFTKKKPAAPAPTPVQALTDTTLTKPAQEASMMDGLPSWAIPAALAVAVGGFFLLKKK